MKKIFTLIAAALMSASMFAQPATVPTVNDLDDAGYDLTSRVICLYFDEQVYYDIVWAGSYNGWSIDNPASMIHFEPLEGYQGWYACQVNDDSDPCQGKPVQLKKDGSFSWDFQSGDVEAWINMAQPGTKTATIGAGNNQGEANCTWPTTGAYIYEVAYFKNHNSPYVADNPKHDYTITAYLPPFCDEIAAYADSVRVMGSFDNWTDGVWMLKTLDEDYNCCWTAKLNNVEEGTEFKLRFGTDADWAVQVQLNGQDLENMTTGECTDIVLQYDGEGYGFATPEYKYTEYENWQIKYEGSGWVNMTKLEEGLFMLAEINWETRFGFNFKSDDNPIKKDWYDPDDPDVVIGEEVNPPIYADVYLRVIDDETLKIGIGVEPPIQFVDTASGLKFEITSMEEPRTVKVINNEYPGTSYTVPGTVTYGEKTFDVTEIGVEAFHDCSSLESITLPESVTTLAYGSLAASGLKSITIPATVTTIGEYAFAECFDLKSVTFQGNAYAIGDNAFYDVGTTTTPATLTLPDNWAGSTPENSETPWYGGYFDYDAPAPASGPTVDETGITVNGRKYGFPVRLVKEVK